MMIEIALGDRRCRFSPWTPERGRVLGPRFAFDTETTRIDDEDPLLIPSLVLATACDGDVGVIVHRDHVAAFFAAHAGCSLIAHNAAYDLKVTQPILGPGVDLYALVERGRVWDTMLLHRLHSLATAGHTARGRSTLAHCVRTHLGIELPKELDDGSGGDVRTGFGRHLGRPLSAIPTVALEYAARDVLGTWLLFVELNRRIKDVLRASSGVWGHVSGEWLGGAIARFGPLTHHVQLRASILCDAMTAAGIGIDAGRRAEKQALLEGVLASHRERLRLRGYLPGQPGCDKALQTILRDFYRKHPEVGPRMTESGRYSMKGEDLGELACHDEFFGDLSGFKAATKLLSTYVGKMGRARIHPKFGCLMETGRTSCSGFNVQNLPRDKTDKGMGATIRGCLVPAPGHVFIDADYSQIELVALAHATREQFRLGDSLAESINRGEDIHTKLAGRVLGKPEAEVTKDERKGVKPISFGRPGGMGAETLQSVARAGYGLELTLEEVGLRMRAYDDLCPELPRFLSDEVDVGLVVAREAGLTPAVYCEAMGRRYDASDPSRHRPEAWLGWTLLKATREGWPSKKDGRPYTEAELEYLRAAALTLPPCRDRPPGRGWPDPAAREAVKTWAGRRPVFTLTGRLRAGATFCSGRNTVFQGLAADGALLGLWRVWRAGHRIVSFVHDQVVVETPEDGGVEARRAEVVRLMREGMAEVLPGMRIGVESEIRRSLSEADTVSGTASFPPVTAPPVATPPPVLPPPVLPAPACR